MGEGIVVKGLRRARAESRSGSCLEAATRIATSHPSACPGAPGRQNPVRASQASQCAGRQPLTAGVGMMCTITPDRPA